MNGPANNSNIEMMERAGSADVRMVSRQSGALVPVTRETQALLGRMFADPRTLEKHEKVELVAQLRTAVEEHPTVSELRVLLGMALCVNLQAQDAMEELAEAVSLAPDSFIAHLKMGELWMRLRVCDKAVDHTNYAAKLAENMAQAELARRQSATLREFMRNGIDRNGYRTPWLSLSRIKRLWSRNRGEAEALATVDAG
jgi:hypothetical protein